MRTLLSDYRDYARFVVRLPWLCALCCQITVAMRTLMSHYYRRIRFII